MMRRLIGWGSLVAVLGLLVALWAVPATASSPSPSPSASHSPAKAKRLCARVPTATTKVDRALAKLQADASTRGSIAWLNAQAAKAKNGERAAALKQRAKIRTDRVTVLKDRKTALAQAATWCKNNGYS